ncbi:hypothetical protein CBR_g29427 [Chara braunii]|uniref:protein disulfide-isomerase n=1 Tax=Chara braunii TaxID=69332 RepID=A0A388LAD3_CHABU|nr:hypothetical protein CBR_g29427 [Chara braunii]|eukprot:GBG79277.1 hypothetical protein CBR_g29427 [Chara braunii]
MEPKAGHSGRLFAAVGVLVCLFAVAVSQLPGALAAEEDVLVLDFTNYTDSLPKYSFLLVAYVAPWCKYSKRLKTPYDAAAGVLKSDSPKITLARVDASDDENRPIALQNDINDFPTLKIFRNGQFFMPYAGPLDDTEGMVAYLRRQAGPASLEITERAQAVAHLAENPVVAIGVFDKLEGTKWDAFKQIAEEVRTEIPFVHTTNVELLGVRGGPFTLSPPGFRVYTAFDKEIYDSNEFDTRKMKAFVEDVSTPRVISTSKDPKIGAFVMKSFDGDEPKVFALVRGNGKDAAELISAIKAEADGKFGKLYRFIVTEVTDNPQALHYYGVQPNDVPTLVIHDTVKEKKYLLPNATAAAVPLFLEDFRARKLVESIKSQPIPEKDDDLVKTVVMKNFDEVVKQAGKNVLILFYAPWCNVCKRLMPSYEEVAKEFQDDDEIVVAKFDATANDIVDKKFSVRSYPTIYFRSSMGVLTWYAGKGETDDVIAFVDMHRGAGLGDMDGEEGAVLGNVDAEEEEEAEEEEVGENLDSVTMQDPPKDEL